MLFSTEIKNMSITVFFIVLSFCTWNLYNFSKEKINNIEKEVLITRNISLNEIQSLRKGTFQYLYAATDKIDSRLNSLEKNTFNQINSLRIDTFERIDSIEENVMVRVDNMQSTVNDVATDYRKIPNNLDNLYTRFDVQTDCEINDLCWQNMTSDLLIDSRNVMRDASITYRTVNESVPQITENVSEMTTTISDATPRITENVGDITENVNRMTKPKWYHKVLSYSLGTIGIIIAAK